MFCKSAAAISSLFLIGSAFAQQPIPCGAVITRSLVLRANIGPCTQTALRVPLGADHITIDLNGFRIVGTGVSGTAGIEVRSGAVTIQGPGTITRFDRGISIVVPGSWWEPRGTVVQRLHLDANRTGVWIEPDQFVEAYGLTRILRTVISGPGQTGIRIDRTDQTEISQSLITGQDGYGVQAVVARHITVTGNSLTRNNNGLNFDHWSDQAVITGNDVSDNRLDGIQTASRGVLIEDNVASRNGRDGIVMSQFLVRAKDNRAFNNGRRGIAVTTLDLTPSPGPVAPDTIHVGGNDARNNGADLYWDLTGRRNCWADNKFRTSVPMALPACP